MITLDAFYGKYNGQSVSFDGLAINRGQCVQLVSKYVQEVWGKPVIWANAYPWYANNALPDQYIRIANDHNDPNQVPPRGALMCWGPNLPGSGGDGHISICWDARPGAASFVSFDSNWGGKTAHLVTHNWQYVVGWIIPRGLPTQTPVPQQGGDEVITTQDDARLIYRILRPNSAASQGEIDATAGKRTFHNFIHDALPEIQVRDANLAKQSEELGNMQAIINELNRTVTDLRSSQTTDAQARAEEQHAAQEKISYLTSQLETKHDKITQLQQVNVPLAGQQLADKPNWLTGLIISLLPKKK